MPFAKSVPALRLRAMSYRACRAGSLHSVRPSALSQQGIEPNTKQTRTDYVQQETNRLVRPSVAGCPLVTRPEPRLRGVIESFSEADTNKTETDEHHRHKTCR